MGTVRKKLKLNYGGFTYHSSARPRTAVGCALSTNRRGSTQESRRKSGLACARASAQPAQAACGWMMEPPRRAADNRPAGVRVQWCILRMDAT